jgi:hypothetical protein
MAPSGALGVRVFRATPTYTGSLWSAVRAGLPAFGLTRDVFWYRVRNLPNLLRGVWRIAVAQLVGAPTMFGVVSARVRRAATGIWDDLGVLSCRVVTNNGVAFIVDAFDNTLEAEIMNYHGCGTTNTAENASDSALGAESTTILNPDSTRATGTQTQPSANVYQTVGTLTFDGAGAIVEHGLFSQAATGGGVLFDRSVFSTINVASGDSIQFTYQLTLTAGS